MKETTVEFMGEDFLLYSEAARRLYHEYAREMPIFDYHCHLPPKDIAENRQFRNITELWLGGDHYKWRALRAAGVPERLITGDADDFEKFKAWARVVPLAIRNPLYHWTHMELRNPFGITRLLDEDSAADIYARCNEALRREDFRVRGLLAKMKVKVVCTTDDPLDGLDHHAAIRNDPGFPVRVFPGFRPDKGMAVDKQEVFNEWVNRLEAVSNKQIRDYGAFLEAVGRRHEFFHDMGCRLSDHGIEEPYAEEYTESEIIRVFQKVRSGRNLERIEARKFKSAMLHQFAVLDADRNWTMQLHLGALRNTNSRGLRRLGADTGYDSIGDFELASSLARFYDRLEAEEKLPRSIVYVLNPGDFAIAASLLGSFQDGRIAGKMQFGPAWWFNDTRRGMEEQLNVLSDMGLLSQFVGMTTDSRSFLSYPRHEYFRRILCNLIGAEVERGELPADLDLLGRIVQDICYHNAVRYFGLNLG